MTLQEGAYDAYPLKPLQHPQTRVWTEIHATAYNGSICRHATLLKMKIYIRHC
jgi:hypothetical protein